jgi:putative membrane protein
MADEKEYHSLPPSSHAAELLASERTFLAWIRTSIAALSFGIAIIKFGDWTRASSQGIHVASSIGTLMVLFGGIMSALGAIHYRRTNKQILEGKVQVSNWLVLSMSAGVVLLAIAVIIYVVLQAEG